MRTHLITATAIALLAPAAASATDARVITTDDGVRKLQVHAMAGQVNRVTITQQLTGFVVEDSGALLGYGEHCSSLAPHRVHCTANGVAGIEVHLLDGDDVATVDATPPAMLAGDSGDDQLTGGVGADTLFGSEGQDVLDGRAGADVLAGGEGNDILAWSPGADRMGGGTGADIADYEKAPAGVAVTLDEAPNDGVRQGGASPDGDNVLGDVEGVLGTSADDLLAGNAGNQTLVGGDGTDTLTGGAGSDSLIGGAGDDTLEGLDGEPDDVSCGDGTDTLSADLFDSATDCEARTPAPPAPAEPTPAPTADPVPTATATPVIKDTLAPRLSKVRRRGRTVSFRLSEPATVSVRVRKDKVLKRTLPAGRHRIALRRERLTFRLRLRATDAAGNRSAIVTLGKKGGRS